MQTMSFRQLPLLARVAVGVTFFNTWISLEEFVINRTGMWHYMPYYQTDAACVWDLAVALLIIVGIWRLSARRPHSPTAADQQRVRSVV